MVLEMMKTSLDVDDTSSGRRGQSSSIQLIDPFKSIKSEQFSRQTLEFINGNHGNIAGRYTDQQMLSAYMSSVYMFAALRRVANLISRVKIVVEIEEGGDYVRAPETMQLNEIFKKEGSATLSRMWLNYAVYGAAVVYKVKTKRAVIESNRGMPIYDYKDGAVAGLHVLDKPLWSIDERSQYGDIQGIYVNQYTPDGLLGDRNYLERGEFVHVTDWNPQSPNRGQSIVSVAIHEAVSNASIAQWMSEYFTRGAMPFIMVSMEEDPAFMTESDLRKYKRQFEQYWQGGIGSSLRSVFLDRRVSVEQIGISADEIAAPELNETALEGIASAVGLDRKLIVTNDGGAYAEHVQLVKRAWEDTVIPLAKKFMAAFERDLGLPDGMKLTLDLSDVSELDADRQNKADTELSIYETGLQSFNETRTRVNMSPVPALEGWYQDDGQLMPLDSILQKQYVPSRSVVDYALDLWSNNLAKRSEVLQLIGRELPQGESDGYMMDLEQKFDYVTQLWSDDLLTRAQVLEAMNYPMPDYAQDGYRSELERGADYGEFVTQLWSDNLLTRSQAIRLLDMDVEMPFGAPDGYAEEIGNRNQNILDYWDSDLMTREEAIRSLDIQNVPDKMIGGFRTDVETELEIKRAKEEERVGNIMDFWDSNLLTRNKAMELLGMQDPPSNDDGFQNELEERLMYRIESDERNFDYTMEMWGDNIITRSQAMERLGVSKPTGDFYDGYMDEVEEKTRLRFERGEMQFDRVMEFWGDNIITRSQALERLGITPPENMTDGYINQVETIDEAIAEKKASEITGEEQSGGGGFRSLDRSSDPDDEPIAGAEEHLVSESANINEPLNAPYGDDVDIIPPSVLPHAKSKLMFKAMSDYEDNNIWAGIQFGRQGDLIRVQNKAKQYYLGASGVEWVRPDDFHLTMSYMKNPDKKVWKKIIQELPDEIVLEALSITGYGLFANDDSIVLYAHVELPDEVRRIQRDIYDCFEKYQSDGSEMSEYSIPDDWRPHITLAYMQPGTNTGAIENEKCYGRVIPQCIDIAYGKSGNRFRIEVVSLDVLLDGHDEPDGSEAVMDDKYIRQQQEEIKQFTRNADANKFKAWYRGGKISTGHVKFDDLPYRVKRAVRSQLRVAGKATVKRSDVDERDFNAIMSEIDANYED